MSLKRIAPRSVNYYPYFGKGMNLYLGLKNDMTGDYVGAVGGADTLHRNSMDFANTTRDIYKDVYDVFPEDEEDVDLT